MQTKILDNNYEIIIKYEQIFKRPQLTRIKFKVQNKIKYDIIKCETIKYKNNFK